jgi:hypothetical protein
MSESQRRQQANRRPGPLKTHWLAAPATPSAGAGSKIEPVSPDARAAEVAVETHSTRQSDRYRPSPDRHVKTRARKRNDYDGRYRISFFEDGKRVFYLTFLTPEDAIWKCDLYEQAVVGYESDSRPIYANWIDPERTHGATEVKRLLRRFSEPPEPKERQLAVGMLFTPTPDGRYAPSYGDTVTGGGELLPRTGLIVQGTYNFWRPLYGAIPNLDGRLIRVKKSGSRINRTFSFCDLGPVPQISLPQEHRIDLDAYIDEISDLQRIRRLVQPLDRRWRFY